ncbi:MAG: hypothetical protein E7335_04445 [Clostridiales bacterium]|nr:hypothetical protein [Clostridiales bacterium]
MANKFKRSFAMVLALCMLVLASPVHALAEESVYPDDINADLTVDQTNGTIEIVFTPVDGAEGGDLEWESDLTLGENIETELSDLSVTEEKTEDGDTIVTESATIVTEGTLENGADSNGEEVLEEITDTEAEDAQQNGEITINGEETHVEITTTEADGTVTETDVTDGYEKIEWTGDGIENIEDVIEGLEDLEGLENIELPSVEIELNPGETTEPVTEKSEVPVTGTVGDEKEGEDDTEYNYTDITIEVDRTVSAEASDLVVTPPSATNNYDSPVDPTTDTDKNWDTSSKTKEDPQRNGLEKPAPGLVDLEDVLMYERWQEGDDIPEGFHVGDIKEDAKGNYIIADEPQEIPEGYDFFHSGMGEYTDAAAPVFKYIVYQRDESGEIIYGEDGKPLVDEEKSYLMNGSNGKAPESGMDYQPGQLGLTNIVCERYTEEDLKNDLIPEGKNVGDIKYDENGKPVVDEEQTELFYAYCADFLVETDADAMHWYKMENLEDSGHYTEEDAQKLRAIVMNGYWGDAEVGTVEQIVANLTEYVQDMPEATDEEKAEMLDLLLGMKEHEALAVTQAAIWAYSVNRTNTAYMDGKLPAGVDNVEVIGAQSAIKCYAYDAKKNKTSWYTEYKAAVDQMKDGGLPLNGAYVNLSEEVMAERVAEAIESDARMALMFEYLMSLEGIPDTDEDVTTVINENNFIEDDSLSLVIHDRVEDHEDNKDDNHDNDVYDTDLKFSLAFVPGEKDELLVYLYGIGDEPIVRRLSGTGNDGIEDITTDTDANGNTVYVFKDLQLSENSNTKFDLRLDGVHHLNQGVYLYTAQGGRLASQTFVGMASGSQDIDITASMTISFNVDENNHVVAERYWHNESDPETTPPTKDEPPVISELPPSEDEEEPTPPVRYRLSRNVGQLETIIDEEVPLAEVPETGDISMVWFAMVLVAGMGLCMLKLAEKKCKA